MQRHASETAGTRLHVWLTVAPVFALLFVAGVAGCSAYRSVEAFHLISDIAAGDAPSTLKNKTSAPVRGTIAYTVAGRRHTGDIYWPGKGDAKAAAVFVPGVVKDGKDDPRIVAFATSFARMGFLVLVPEIPNLRSLMISAADAEVVADAIRHLSATGGFEGELPIGLFAFSYAAGPALIAAMEHETLPLLRFVYVVGPYYSAESVVTFFTTGHYRLTPAEPWSKLEPNPYARWVFLRSNAGRVENAKDRETLFAIGERKLADANADISDLTAALGPEGRSIYALLANRDPDRVPDLIARLPSAIRSELNALDLSRRNLSAIRARIVVVHGRGDPMIPFTESTALVGAAHRADLFVLDSLSHVELDLSGLSDFLKLWRVAYLILNERDGMPPPHYPGAEEDR